MEIKTDNRSIPRATTWVATSSDSGSSNTVITQRAPWTEGSVRHVYKVDPLRQFIHGNYQLSTFFLNSMPFINGSLKYTTRQLLGSPPARVKKTISLTGHAFGFTVPRARWLYEQERNRSTLINQAIQGALNEQVNLALFIGELDKTQTLFARKAMAISDAALDVRRGKFASAARRLGIKKPRKARRDKTFANNWLEFSYGWAPLVYDSVGLMKHIATRARSVTVGSRSRIGTFVKPLSWTGQVNHGQEGASQHRFLATFNVNGTWTAQEQVSLVFELPSDFWDQVKSLGFMDPGVIAWEAIPLSFVVDWFANIGDWLGSQNLGLVLKYATGSYVEIHRTSGNVGGTATWFDLKNTLYTYQEVSSTVTGSPFTEVLMRRTPIPINDVVTTLQLRSPLSTNNAITAAALVVQRLKS